MVFLWVGWRYCVLGVFGCRRVLVPSVVYCVGWCCCVLGGVGCRCVSFFLWL